MAELFTLEDLAAFRRSDEPYRPDDDIAVRATATGLVRGFCGWHVAPTQTDTVPVTVRQVGVAGYSFFLPTLHLTAAPTITLADASEPTDFAWTPGGVVSRDGGWGALNDALTVEMVHGYPEGSTQHALIRGVALGVAARLTGSGGASLLPEEEAQLFPLRLLVLA